MGPADFEHYNPNNVGGAITGGAATLGPARRSTPLQPSSVCHGDRRRLPVLFGDGTGGRNPRHVRLSRRTDCAPQDASGDEPAASATVERTTSGGPALRSGGYRRDPRCTRHFTIHYAAAIGEHLPGRCRGADRRSRVVGGRLVDAATVRHRSPSATYRYQLDDRNGVDRPPRRPTAAVPPRSDGTSRSSIAGAPDSARRSAPAHSSPERGQRYPAGDGWHGADDRSAPRARSRARGTSAPGRRRHHRSWELEPATERSRCGRRRTRGGRPTSTPRPGPSSTSTSSPRRRRAVRGRPAPNRADPANGRHATIVNDDEIRRPAELAGRRHRHPRVLAPHPERGVGIGQFTDLMRLADWAAANGIAVVQLLPVNDTVHRPQLARLVPVQPGFGPGAAPSLHRPRCDRERRHRRSR